MLGIYALYDHRRVIMARYAFKKIFRKEIVSDYIALLKENTVNLFIIDHQAEIVAFAYKKYRELISQGYDDTEELKRAIFDDTWSIIAELFNFAIDSAPGASLIDDPQKVYFAFVNHKLGMPDDFIYEYYYRLNNNLEQNSMQLYHKYCLPFTF